MKTQRVESSAGFTLIEILVAFVVISVGALALGSFGLTTMSSGQTSRERLTAVHLAEQVLEHWQQDANDYAPTIAADCTMSAASAAPSYPTSDTCNPATGVGIAFTIAANTTNATGPLASNLTGMQNFTQPTGYLNTPMTKLVTVSWTRRGKSRTVYLTHLSKVY
ncbi:prepilin-type N-terminal cleavage/methylation domain-containing protein [Mariprofundus aestuarium]|uniref:Prepilin-type N-terminal cleavage/methylation domain-containing protein n=1 Tax=Mariprofundus aestuarium TaxID=1921086 RepID=A0A2K8L3Y8_MARES|nr:prepilin-type N-terminal cleavage/methylation domain-containing protein [Mariprofundus aestuarium]ATX78956.1 prepilin-type N-terminal cleavage/methylation domain-containing protein [Mariprofundus aestuarium]